MAPLLFGRDGYGAQWYGYGIILRATIHVRQEVEIGLDRIACEGTSTDLSGKCWISPTLARDLIRSFRRAHVVCGVPIWNSRGRLDVQLEPAYFGLSAVVLWWDLCNHSGLYIGTREYNWCFEHRLLVTLLIRYPNGFFLPEGREGASLTDLIRQYTDHTGYEGFVDNLSPDPSSGYSDPILPLTQLSTARFIRYWVRDIFARVLDRVA